MDKSKAIEVATISLDLLSSVSPSREPHTAKIRSLGGFGDILGKRYLEDDVRNLKLTITKLENDHK